MQTFLYLNLALGRSSVGSKPAQGVFQALLPAAVYGVCAGYFSQFFFNRCDPLSWVFPGHERRDGPARLCRSSQARSVLSL